MCEFCETTKEEVERFHEWADANPYEGDAQVSDGLDYVLDGNTFSVVAMFDGGYIHGAQSFEFNYCPMCGRKL